MINSQSKINTDQDKWAGTGLEDVAASQYQDPAAKRNKQKTPLFPKSTPKVIDLQGKPIIDQGMPNTEQEITQLQKSVANNLNKTRKPVSQGAREYLKNKIASPSKFFILKESTAYFHKLIKTEE